MFIHLLHSNEIIDNSSIANLKAYFSKSAQTAELVLPERSIENFYVRLTTHFYVDYILHLKNGGVRLAFESQSYPVTEKKPLFDSTVFLDADESVQKSFKIRAKKYISSLQDIERTASLNGVREEGAPPSIVGVTDIVLNVGGVNSVNDLEEFSKRLNSLIKRYNAAVSEDDNGHVVFADVYEEPISVSVRGGNIGNIPKFTLSGGVEISRDDFYVGAGDEAMKTYFTTIRHLTDALNGDIFIENNIEESPAVNDAETEDEDEAIFAA